MSKILLLCAVNLRSISYFKVYNFLNYQFLKLTWFNPKLKTKLIIKIEESKCVLLISSLYYKRAQSFICGSVTGSSVFIHSVWRPSLKCHSHMDRTVQPGKARLTVFYLRGEKIININDARSLSEVCYRFINLLVVNVFLFLRLVQF